MGARRCSSFLGLYCKHTITYLHLLPANLPTMAVSKKNVPSLPPASSIYSHYTVTPGGLIFCSGQIPQDESKNIVQGGIQPETTQCINNLSKVLENAGSDWDHVVKVNIYLKSMADFNAMNEVYEKMLPEVKPSRTCIQAGKLPRDVNIEIECIAAMPIRSA